MKLKVFGRRYRAELEKKFNDFAKRDVVISQVDSHVDDGFMYLFVFYCAPEEKKVISTESREATVIA